MVKVEIVKDSCEQTRSFRIEGHTGYADHGQDIICAGISAITQTALVGLLNYLDREPVYHIESGILSCSLAADLSDEDAFKAKVILGTMEMGLREIEKQYNDFLELRIRRC